MKQGLERTGEPELAGVEGVLQRVEQQTAEEAGQDPDRQKEAGAARDPLGAVTRQAATRYHAMQMWMEDECLAPGVQYGEEPDLGAEMGRIRRDGAQRRRG